MTKAVIDRFEGKFAVLIVGQGEKRMDIPRISLPKGAREGSWLQVEIADGLVSQITIDEDETDRAKKRIADKLEALRHGDHLKKGE